MCPCCPVAVANPFVGFRVWNVSKSAMHHPTRSMLCCNIWASSRFSIPRCCAPPQFSWVDQQYRAANSAALAMTDVGAANQRLADATVDVSTGIAEQSAAAGNDSGGAKGQPFSSNFLSDSLSDGGFLNSDLFATSDSGGHYSGPTVNAASDASE